MLFRSSPKIEREYVEEEIIRGPEIKSRYIEPHKNLLIYDDSNCKWNYIGPEGKLHAVTVVDGELRYVKNGKIEYIDLKSTEMEIKK